MASLTYNTSLYTRINKWDSDYTYKGVLVASKINQKNGQDYKLVDAIDIDWDGIWFDSLKSYINTTDDLIGILERINTTSDVNVFREQIEHINELLDSITASYVNTSYLGEILSAYQHSLVPGANITIDPETNVITTYGFLNEDMLAEALSSYATLSYVGELKTEIYTYFPDIPTSHLIAYTEAKKLIDEIVDGADEAFDTLKEVADWINSQNHFEEVPYSELVQDGEYVATYDVYIYNDSRNEYVVVTPEYVLEHPDDKYYKMSNVMSDIAKLFKDLGILDERVGHKILNDDGYSYTYTGLVYDIYKLQMKTDNMQSSFDRLERIGVTAYNTATTAYGFAYNAYELASYSLSITTVGIDEAHIAYELAVKASEDVGVPTIEGYYSEATEEQIQSGVQLYYYDESKNTYKPLDYDPEVTLTWYVYNEGQEATGLTERVEDVEHSNILLDNRITELSHEVDTTLYKLDVNNENSSYVTLSMSPETFNGLPNRTINITTYNAQFVVETGEVLEDGLITVDIARDIYSYAVTWEIFPSPSSEEPENDEENG